MMLMTEGDWLRLTDSLKCRKRGSIDHRSDPCHERKKKDRTEDTDSREGIRASVEDLHRCLLSLRHSTGNPSREQGVRFRRVWGNENAEKMRGADLRDTSVLTQSVSRFQLAGNLSTRIGLVNFNVRVIPGRVTALDGVEQHGAACTLPIS